MVINLKKPFIPITEIEQSAFCQTDDELNSKTLEEEFKAGVRWQKLPTSYMRLTPEELDARIAEARAALGKRLVILGHHYQRDEIIKYADYRGDSFKLSQFAASQEDAENIIFCGVHFMAETADILSAPDQNVILPNLTAGCSMADMAHVDDVYDCWDDLQDILGDDGGIVPITYMNSTAGIKALCGRNGGIVCTSSNAPATFEWAYSQGQRVLFLPDQHLGRNTGLKMGIGLDEMLVWNPFKPLGGHTKDELRRAKLILWQGHCSVHTRFSVAQIEEARQKYPDINIVVHPECTMEVVQAADFVGSTEYIIKVISEAPSGSKWAVGTEVNLVNRVAAEHPDKTVFSLDPVVCPCSTMYRIHPAYLSWVLDGLVEGVVVNPITVDEETAEYARIALDRMLSVA
jgi:quinolinate synthase